jgi:hypothetical protein
MSTPDLRTSPTDATVWDMFDPIPLLIARDRVHAGIERPVPERSPAGARVLAAALLHRLADRVEGRAVMHPRPATRSAAAAQR